MVSVSRHTLDVRGLICPMPVIRAQSKIAELCPGDELEITATDPGALVDIPAWCRVHGHEVLAVGREGTEVRILVRVRDT